MQAVTKLRNAVLLDKFFSLSNHVLYTKNLDATNTKFDVDDVNFTNDTVEDEESNNDRRAKRLFDNYVNFLSLMRQNACDHRNSEKRYERRQLRANDEAATLIVICCDCGGIVTKY